MQVRQGEDGAQAVVVVGAGGEGRAFGDAGVLVGEWWCEWMGEGQGVDVLGEEEDGDDGDVERWMHAVCVSLSHFLTLSLMR